MKKIVSSIIFLSFLAAIAYVSQFYQRVEFVPITTFNSLNSQFEDKAFGSIYTYPPYYSSLKKRLPNISILNENDPIQKDQIVLIPFWKLNEKHKLLTVNGRYFYEPNAETINARIFSLDQLPIFDTKQINSVVIGGTVVLARGVHNKIKKHNDPKWPWYGTASLFREADFAAVNFKSPLVNSFKYPKSRWRLIGPASYIQGAQFAGIDLIGISGNHMGDAGTNGLLETIKIAKSAGIDSIGAGRHKKEAYRPYIFEMNGYQYGFLAFNNVYGSIQKAKNESSGIDSTGIAWLDQDAITAIRSLDSKVDVLIVLVNWGTEYQAKPNPKEMNWAKKMADAGADIILGDQAHWVQNYEFIKQKNNTETYVAYGLGNFIFDQYWSEKTKEGLIEKLIFYNGSLIQIHHIPVKLDTTGQIKIQTGQSKLNILKQFYGF